MSLCITLHNAHGIIMSADHMICSTINKDEKTYRYQSSETEQKLFLIENKYGLSYSGDSNIGATPVSAFLENYIDSNSISASSPSDWLFKLAQTCNKLLEPNQNIVFILSGYYGSEKFIATTNTLNPEITFYENEMDIIYSGESRFVSHLISADIIKFDFAKFTLQDSINFLRFLNKTISGLMHFGQYLPTVSETCDVLAILPNKTYWVEHLTLQ